MRKSNTLTHNHNYLMGTIIFEVHPITLTSPRNTLGTIFKSILIFFAFDFLFIFFFLSISCMGTKEREEEIPNYVSLNINILLCRSTQMLFMIGGF